MDFSIACVSIWAYHVYDHYADWSETNIALLLALFFYFSMPRCISWILWSISFCRAAGTVNLWPLNHILLITNSSALNYIVTLWASDDTFDYLLQCHMLWHLQFLGTFFSKIGWVFFIIYMDNVKILTSP